MSVASCKWVAKRMLEFCMPTWDGPKVVLSFVLAM